MRMLDLHGGPSPLEELRPVAHAHEITKLIEAVREGLIRIGEARR